MTSFQDFFTGKALAFLHRAADLALDEDGPDLTARAVFSPTDRLTARIRAKEPTLVAGLPMADVVFERMGILEAVARVYHAQDGDLALPDGASPPCSEAARRARRGPVVAVFEGPAEGLLKAERVILNFLCHLSGIANLTARYVSALEGSRTRLLDTRKTLPGLRYPEKYAVRVGGGHNHRMDLAVMLMLKDNHVDRAGGVPQAVEAVRRSLPRDCPPLEVECRSLDEVRQAVALRPERIMLDNMDMETMRHALETIPPGIETELSGGVSLEQLPQLARLGADFVSVGRITHSAPYADYSMQLDKA
ncbi:putative nicotinate-nucleotide pyrophosphorylase [carboxylating] [Fundidesulfovibrio magnetotacticus]|uniref:nicotinate-nucleotide diphosphorylase (carboxylating) n=1 Tax=Fundidesulfovibrio magnetotacticus TaxID=2730080 RepID=A0A6V8LX19_9BACT|nr:carboxylating nicotinate-nucleotide diphosphorylase [Fundidesulfovibrio magnetotacticus]GFK94346.1 putative nicotinate-nucleotide pyrophosphorylase [carboxylating] [Fundidesulfovibrio magnetotacticus]